MITSCVHHVMFSMTPPPPQKVTITNLTLYQTNIIDDIEYSQQTIPNKQAQVNWNCVLLLDWFISYLTNQKLVSG